MLKSYSKFFLVTIIFLTAISCEKMLFESPEANNTAVFEYIWQYTKDHYCCFDFKEVNWNDVYDIYALQVSDDMEETEFINLIHDMLSTLEDRNLSITGRIGEFSYESDTIYPENLDTNTVKLYNPTSLKIIIYEGAGYANKFNSSLCGEVDYIKDDISGMVVDLRGLSEFKGLSDFLHARTAQFVIDDECKDLGKNRYKNGTGDNDYGEREIFTNPCENNYVEPVVVLCNRKTLGDANREAYLLSIFPNCTLIGDHTGGGNFEEEYSYLANGWMLGIPKMTIIDVNGQSIGNGIEPDIYVSDDPATTDVDEIIEAALDLLN